MFSAYLKLITPKHDDDEDEGCHRMKVHDVFYTVPKLNIEDSQFSQSRALMEGLANTAIGAYNKKLQNESYVLSDDEKIALAIYGGADFEASWGPHESVRITVKDFDVHWRDGKFDVVYKVVKPLTSIKVNIASNGL